MIHLTKVSLGLLASLAITVAEDYVCPAGKTDTDIVVEAGDSFDFRTQEGAKYSGNVDCVVRYEMGETCAKMSFSCSSFKLGKGDTLFVKSKRNKKFRKTKFKTQKYEGDMIVRFKTNKKKNDIGAECIMRCIEEADVTTSEPTTVSTEPTTTTVPEPSCNCGIANKPSKIYGGEQTLPHEYPWNVYVSLNRDGGWYLCGGALISSQHVLTAAHCVDEGQEVDKIFLRLGAHDKTKPEIEAKVSKVDVNSNWDMDASFGSNVYAAPDAAILTMTEPIEFNYKIRPVCLPSDPSVTYEGEVCQATGWGRIEDNKSPKNLMEVDVKIISIEDCRNSYSNVYDIHICATGVGAPDFGTRGGDSGSPLNLPEVGGRYSVIGINSFNSDPDVFSKVTPELKDWILSVTNGAAQIADPTSTTGCSQV